MTNIMDYLKEGKSFKELPFNEIDSLILSQLSYFHFNHDIPLLEEDNAFVLFDKIILDDLDFVTNGLLYKERNISLIKAVRISKRFKNLKVNYYQEIVDYEQEMQFSAVTFNIEGINYVSYRGTDATILGWKEDFNMAYMCPVPAQRMAIKYLKMVMKKIGGIFYLGGHSKGGNLAIYAGMNINLWQRNKIKKIFSHDGPGFRKQIYDSLRYRLIRGKIFKTVPQSSIIGMVMFSREDIRVVKSNTVGIFQHNAFSWIIKNDRFVYLKDRAEDSKYIDQTVTDWLSEIDDDKRKVFVDTLYEILKNENYDSFMDLKKNWFKVYATVKKDKNKLDPETRKIIDEIINRLIYYGTNNLKIAKNVKKILQTK